MTWSRKICAEVHVIRKVDALVPGRPFSPFMEILGLDPGSMSVRITWGKFKNITVARPHLMYLSEEGLGHCRL